MACTIDHLERDCRITVLRAFVDLRGTRHAAGATGILRDMDVDFGAGEIWMEWERDGMRERLVFALRAKEGPRSGGMREFFDVGEMVPSESRHRRGGPAPAPGEEPEATRDSRGCLESARAGILHEAGAASIGSGCLDEREVACACDPRLARPVMVTGTEPRLFACLACGTVTATVLRGDDGRYSGRACHANFVVPVATEVLAWLGRWPRVDVDYAAAQVRWPMPAAWVQYPKWFIPASVRCHDAAAWSALESRLRTEQAGRSRRQILRDAACPTDPPPSGIPRGLSGFVDLWEVLRLGPESDLKKLVRLAQVGGAASEIAAELLASRADAAEVMEHALRSDDASWRSAGMAMVRAGCGNPARLASVLVELLETLPLAPSPEVPDRLREWARWESILLMIAERRLAVPRVLEALPKLRRKIALKDPGVVEAMRLVEAELRGA